MPSPRALRERLPYKWVVAAVFVVGLFMDIMDTTIVNVALKTMADDLGAELADVEWIVLGYLLSLAVWIPASGWLGDRYGTKRTFLVALAMFTGASVLCGLATNLSQLIAFRILQGVGGGMLTPVGTAMLFRAFPPAERARASTVLIIPTVLAPAAGPVVGGYLVTNASWRWIFYVNVPLGIAGLLFGAFFLREHREPSAGRFDVPGFVLSGAGLALVLFGLSEGAERGWAAPLVVGPLVVGLTLFVALVAVERRTAEPMLALRLYKERMFRNSNILLTFTYGSFAGVLFLIPLFLQDYRGLSALDSGLTTFPQAIGVMVASQVAGRLYPRVGPRRLITGGLVVVGIVTSAFFWFDAETNLWLVRAVMFVRGLGMAFSFVPMQAATFANVSAADTGRASAIFSTQRQVAAALGVAVLATIWQTTARSTGSLDGYHAGLLAGTFVVLIGAVLAWTLIRDVDAAATMQHRAAPTAESAEPPPSPGDAGATSPELPARPPAKPPASTRPST